MEAGLDAVGALRHVADHAPTPSTMAVAVASIVEASDGLGGRDPVIAALTVIGRRVTPDDLAAVTERFGLDPLQSAEAFVAAGVATPDTVHTVIARTDGDVDAARTIMTAAIGLSEHGFDRAVAPEFDNVIQFRPIDARSANDDLISALAQPSGVAETDHGATPVHRADGDVERVAGVERAMSTARDL